MGVAYDDAVLFGIREVVEGVDPAEYGLFCAVPNPAAPDDVMLEDRDGSGVRRDEFQRLIIRKSGDKKPMTEVDEIRGRVLVTDARVALACTKYDKGGSWMSAVGVASKAVAAMRRRGKMMVSHVRYPWLVGVYGQNRSGFGSSEILRLVVDLTSKTDTRVQVNVYLPKQSDAVALASEIIRRAARFRLAHEPGLDESDRAEYRAQLEEYAQLPDLRYDKGGDSMAGVSFKRFWAVESHKGALLGTGVTEVPAVHGGFQGFEPA